MNSEINNQQVAEIQIVYKTKVKAADRVKISNSKDSYNVLKHFFEPYMEHREVVYAIYMNTANKVLHVMRISEGAINNCLIDAKILFQGALNVNACNIIIAHNHPTGSSFPSQQDLTMSLKLRDAAKLLDMQLLDSIILTEDSYTSLADDGNM